jgi:hypothetical protein
VKLLEGLLAALGWRELARRTGVTIATIKRWHRLGPTGRGLEALERVARRRVAGLKGIETKGRRKQWRDLLSPPELPYRRLHKPSSGLLDPDVVLPTRSPVETAKMLNRARKDQGFDANGPLDSDIYDGESTWIHIGVPIVNLDMNWLQDQIVRIWQNSDRTWVYVIFLLFRYVPFNPAYKGVAELERLQGKWLPFAAQTDSLGKRGLFNVSRVVEQALAKSIDASKSRMIWLEGADVKTFERRDPINFERAMSRQLRRT